MYRLQWSLDLKMCPIRELGVVILEGVMYGVGDLKMCPHFKILPTLTCTLAPLFCIT